MTAPEPSSQRDDPTILHVDMDAFFASVEALVDPTLRNKPLIVGGSGSRGVVASCSYEARFYGVRSAMPSIQAKRLCPHAVFVDGRHHLYEQYSQQMHDVFASYTPLVEGLSLDEAFLDVQGAQRLFGDGKEIAWSIRRRLADELGLSASVGVATTKHVAKLASVAAKPRASKSGPVGAKGIVVVTADKALEFLHPMSVRALWGVGPKVGERLARLGVTTVGELSRLTVEQLTSAVGAASAKHLHDLAWNIDARGVEPDRAIKSVSHEQTYASDMHSFEEMHLQWVRLSDAVSTRLRKSQLVGRTVTCKVRFATFETVTRSRTLPLPTASAGALLEVADQLCVALEVGRGVRLLGLSVSNFEQTPSTQQLTLLDEISVDAGNSALEDTVDSIRDRYGASAVLPAPLVGDKSQGVFERGQQQWGPSSNVQSEHTRKGQQP